MLTRMPSLTACDSTGGTLPPCASSVRRLNTASDSASVTCRQEEGKGEARVSKRWVQYACVLTGIAASQVIAAAGLPCRGAAAHPGAHHGGKGVVGVAVHAVQRPCHLRRRAEVCRVSTAGSRLGQVLWLLSTKLPC